MVNLLQMFLVYRIKNSRKDDETISKVPSKNILEGDDVRSEVLALLKGRAGKSDARDKNSMNKMGFLIPVDGRCLYNVET